MNVALVGAGRAACHHAAALAELPGARVPAVCDIDDQHACELAGALGAAVRTYAEVLDDDVVDVVALCTPPAGRSALALEAIAAGKAVVVEKPVALRASELDRLIAAGRTAGRPVAAMLQHRGRLTPPMRKLVWSPQTSAAVEVFRHRPVEHFCGTWRNDLAVAGGGIVAHLAVHYLDLACELLGAPREVWATMDFDEGPGIETRSAVVVRFAGGALLTAHASVHPVGKSTRLHIRDGDRTLTIDEARTRWMVDGVNGERAAPDVALLRRAVYREVETALAGEPLGASDIAGCGPVTKLLESIREAACASR